MQHITKDEVLEILKGYEKAGSFSQYAMDFDQKFKNVIQTALDNFENKINSSSILKVSDALSEVKRALNECRNDIDLKVALNFNHHNEQVKALASSEVEEKILKLQKEVKAQLVASNAEASRIVNTKILNFQNEFQNESKQILDGKLIEIEEQINKAHQNKFDSAIESAALNITNIVQSHVSNHFKTINVTISELYEFLHKKFTEELIDKNAIEEQFKETQVEMMKQIDNIINLQLGQARMMMEQSAKAEIKQAIQKFK